MIARISSPALSIIMPVHNSEQYLEETLNSALSQSLKDFELICIDDGSTDTSLQILRRFEAKDSRVRIITQKNLGAGPARNAGLKKASGIYIAFLDSDDLYPNESCLKELYELALFHKAKIAGGSLLFIDHDKTSKTITKAPDFTFPDKRMIKYRNFQQAYYFQRFIYSRKMLLEAGISFPEYKRFQDVVFFVTAMSEAEEFMTTDTPVYVYRKSNKYASLTDAQINDMLRGYLEVLSIAESKGFSRLFSFLSGRINGENRISDMVKSSIQNGNQTAGVLYSKVIHLCSSFNKLHKRFKLLLKTLFSRF